MVTTFYAVDGGLKGCRRQKAGTQFARKRLVPNAQWKFEAFQVVRRSNITSSRQRMIRHPAAVEQSDEWESSGIRRWNLSARSP